MINKNIKEELDLEVSENNYNDMMDKIYRWEADSLLFNIYIMPDGFTGHIKLDDEDAFDTKEFLKSRGSVCLIGGFDNDIGIKLNKTKPTSKQIKVIEKAINYFKPEEVDIYKYDCKIPDIKLKDEDCSPINVSISINKIYEENESLDLEVSKPVKLKKMSDVNNHNYFNKELSKVAYYLSDAGISVLKDWAEDNNKELYREIDRNPEERRVVISKIKPSYMNNSFDYYNIFGHNYFGELDWWGQIPKSIGDRLLYINEDLDIDLDIREHARPSIYRHNINFFEYIYLGEESNNFVEECKDLAEILFNKHDFENFKKFSVSADKVQLFIRGYRNNLVSVIIGLYYNNYPYRWFEKIIHQEELPTVLSSLGISLPNDNTPTIQMERF